MLFKKGLQQQIPLRIDMHLLTSSAGAEQLILTSSGWIFQFSKISMLKLTLFKSKKVLIRSSLYCKKWFDVIWFGKFCHVNILTAITYGSRKKKGLEELDSINQVFSNTFDNGPFSGKMRVLGATMLTKYYMSQCEYVRMPSMPISRAFGPLKMCPTIAFWKALI